MKIWRVSISTKYGDLWDTRDLRGSTVEVALGKAARHIKRLRIRLGLFVSKIELFTTVQG